MDLFVNELINEGIPYFIMSNQLVQDTRLSLKARGLACYMRSMPNNWKFSCRGLMATTGEGQTVIMSALKELMDIGYLERIDGRNEKGYKTSKYILHLTPCVENPCVENPSMENQRTIKRNNNKKNNNINSASKTPKLTKEFIPPTVDEVRTYIQEKGYNVDADIFVEFYASNHWLDSQNKPVKNWKQRVVSWAGGRTKRTQVPRTAQTQEADYEPIWQEVLNRIREPWSVDRWSSPRLLAAVRKVGFSRLQQCSSYDLERMKQTLIKAYKES